MINSVVRVAVLRWNLGHILPISYVHLELYYSTPRNQARSVGRHAPTYEVIGPKFEPLTTQWKNLDGPFVRRRPGQVSTLKP